MKELCHTQGDGEAGTTFYKLKGHYRSFWHTYQLRCVTSGLQNQLVAPLLNFEAHFFKQGRVCQALLLHLGNQVLVLAIVLREVSDGEHHPLG